MHPDVRIFRYLCWRYWARTVHLQGIINLFALEMCWNGLFELLLFLTVSNCCSRSHYTNRQWLTALLNHWISLIRELLWCCQTSSLILIDPLIHIRRFRNELNLKIWHQHHYHCQHWTTSFCFTGSLSNGLLMS